MILKRTVMSLLAVAVLLTTTFTYAPAATFDLDPSHSSVGFKVKHMVVTSVRGTFDGFTGVIEYDAENPSASTVEVTIETASANTRNEDRDKHLVGEDFLDSVNHPTITFKSTSVKNSDAGFIATGDLTIRGVTKSVDLEFELNGPIQNPWGQTIIGVEIKPLKIKRQDFGVSWNKNLDNGGLVVGDDITIEILVEAKQRKEG
jgi:polyisoprenoid-binding protein YceI